MSQIRSFSYLDLHHLSKFFLSFYYSSLYILLPQMLPFRSVMSRLYAPHTTTPSLPYLSGVLLLSLTSRNLLDAYLHLSHLPAFTSLPPPSSPHLPHLISFYLSLHHLTNASLHLQHLQSFMSYLFPVFTSCLPPHFHASTLCLPPSLHLPSSLTP